MTVDQVFIIKKLQNLDEMLVAYSAVTRMPFAICDDESFNDQVWIFTCLLYTSDAADDEHLV